MQPSVSTSKAAWSHIVRWCRAVRRLAGRRESLREEALALIREADELVPICAMFHEGFRYQNIRDHLGHQKGWKITQGKYVDFNASFYYWNVVDKKPKADGPTLKECHEYFKKLIPGLRQMIDDFETRKGAAIRAGCRERVRTEFSSLAGTVGPDFTQAMVEDYIAKKMADSRPWYEVEAASAGLLEWLEKLASRKRLASYYDSIESIVGDLRTLIDAFLRDSMNEGRTLPEVRAAEASMRARLEKMVAEKAPEIRRRSAELAPRAASTSEVGSG